MLRVGQQFADVVRGGGQVGVEQQSIGGVGHGEANVGCTAIADVLYLLDDGGLREALAQKSGASVGARIVDDDDGVILSTAHGPVKVSKAVLLQIGPLSENIKALVSKSTPYVLSVGNRCKLQGYGFHWDPYSDKPYFDLPGGRGKLVLRKENGCAYLDDKDPIIGNIHTKTSRVPDPKTSRRRKKVKPMKA